jgi:GTPase Era involved in 16S rRNA processing
MSVTKTVTVKGEFISYIIGKGGETIKEIRASSGDSVKVMMTLTIFELICF